MEKIYSKVEPDKLLHVINRLSDIKERTILIPEDNFIQCSTLKMEKDKTFRAHKHIWKERTRNVIAQESWIVIRGRVKCIFYDLDDTQISYTPILEPGDASFTLEGGHTYEILEEDTIVYEYKTGPYEGIELDKTFIDD